MAFWNKVIWNTERLLRILRAIGGFFFLKPYLFGASIRDMQSWKQFIEKINTAENRKNVAPVIQRAVVVAALFFALGAAVSFLKIGTLLDFDNSVESTLWFFRTPQLTRLFAWVTFLGNVNFIIFSAVAATIVFWAWHKRNYLISFWLTVIGGQLTSSLGKHFFQRARPLIQVYREDSFSFPSGHATVAVTFYGFLLYYVWSTVKNRSLKQILATILILVMLAIGLSRLYLGVHFPADVIGGYLLGAVWLVLGRGIVEFIFPKKEIASGPVNACQAWVVSGMAILAIIIFYVFFGNAFYNSEIKIPAINTNL